MQNWSPTLWNSCRVRCTGLLARFARRAAETAGAAAIVGLLWAPGRALAIESWPELPLPPKADTQWIAQSMRINGVPTRVLQFESHVSRAEIVEYYRAHWTGGYEHRPSIHPLGEETVVGQVHGPYLMTLKVMDLGDCGGSGGPKMPPAWLWCLSNASARSFRRR